MMTLPILSKFEVGSLIAGESKELSFTIEKNKSWKAKKGKFVFK